MNKVARGSFFTDGRRSSALNIEANEKFSDLGFRLVHDNADRVNRGGCWNDGSRDAHVAGRVDDDPGVRYPDLGLRLCVDWRGE